LTLGADGKKNSELSRVVERLMGELDAKISAESAGDIEKVNYLQVVIASRLMRSSEFIAGNKF